jgi:WD40 repeat protein
VMEPPVEIFNGHKDVLLDLTLSPHSLQLIATSADDKTIRIWNLKISITAIKCYCGYGDEPVTSLLFHPKYDHLLFGATDSTILQFDLSSPGVLIRQKTILFQSAIASSNEITCFAIHPKEDHLLAIGDDDGTVHLFDTQSQSTIKRLSRIHSNLLGKISFSPNNPNILISGGFDSLCCAWDLRRGRPASPLLNFTHLTESQDSSNLQIANPPFVHDLLHVLQGRIVICALGDGKISLYKSSDGSLSSTSQMIDAHRGMVTNLASFPNPEEEGERTDEIVRDYFLSAGADGLIKLWEVREVIGEMESMVPQPTGSRGKKKKGAKESRPPQRRAKEWYEVIERSAIAHPNKVNSLCSLRREGDISIAVADVSCGWSLYRVPLPLVPC